MAANAAVIYTGYRAGASPCPLLRSFMSHSHDDDSDSSEFTTTRCSLSTASTQTLTPAGYPDNPANSYEERLRLLEERKTDLRNLAQLLTKEPYPVVPCETYVSLLDMLRYAVSVNFKSG